MKVENFARLKALHVLQSRLLYDGYRELFPQGSSGQHVKLITHLHLVPKLKIRGNIPPRPQYISMEWYLVKHRDNFTFLPLQF
jgi:hypothetical protein